MKLFKVECKKAAKFNFEMVKNVMWWNIWRPIDKSYNFPWIQDGGVGRYHCLLLNYRNLFLWFDLND
jgi:hypothetical protein